MVLQLLPNLEPKRALIIVINKKETADLYLICVLTFKKQLVDRKFLTILVLKYIF